MKSGQLSLLAGLSLLGTAAQTIDFNFDGGPLGAGTPLDQSSGGITAHFTASGSAYSIQRADVLGFTPQGFSGYCLYPGGVFLSDLAISFSQSLTETSLLYAPEEYATDTSATLRITGYLGSTFVATDTKTIQTPGTWPTGTLLLTSAQPFDNVVIHYEHAPVTGGDYGPIFMVDNLSVVPAPEPGQAAGILGAGAVGTVWLLRRIRKAAPPGRPGAKYG